jgi:hypothetical protein
MAEIEQLSLIDTDPDWAKEWQGMPEYRMEDREPWQTVTVNFRCREDRDAFSRLVDQRVTDLAKSIWFPAEENKQRGRRYKNDRQTNPRYPVYIISKGRWESRLTSKALEKMGVPYHIVIEPQEYEQYAAVIDRQKILVLPFSNRGQGGIPARNWVWEHSISTGAERHWILDDNIDGFIRQNNNERIPVTSGVCFNVIEDFCDRYTNIALSGFNYRFCGGGCRSERIPPFIINTRIYSAILIKNDLPYRWRGRYNEDTDLSLRALKDGWVTILFNAFKVNKAATMTMTGGNTEELYLIEDGRLKMAQSLQEQHPDVVTITEKWDRQQHQVNYAPFKKNKLIRKPGVVIPEGVNNYGMVLINT